MADPREIVVIGGSAGALEPLTKLVNMLPGRLDAALFVVLHTLSTGDSFVPTILSRGSALRAELAEDGAPIQCDRIYVAPPDCHLLIEAGRVKLSSGPKESGHRPAIDPLFRSAARAYGPLVIGVVLSGTLDDGSAGLRVIRRHGGTAIVQEPTEALFPQMPANAIEAANPQHVAPIEEIVRLIGGHTGAGRGQGGEMRESLSRAVSPDGEQTTLGAEDAPGTPTGIACPECHGVLWEADDEEAPKFRCRVGHAYTEDALAEAHGDSVEAALWAGVRALQEQASLTKHLARKAERRGDRLTAARFRERGEAADEHAGMIEAMLLKRTPKPA